MLLEVALAMQQAKGNQRNAKIRGGAQGVASQNTQAAGVGRHLRPNGNFHGKIRNETRCGVRLVGEGLRQIQRHRILHYSTTAPGSGLDALELIQTTMSGRKARPPTCYFEARINQVYQGSVSTLNSPAVRNVPLLWETRKLGTSCGEINNSCPSDGKLLIIRDDVHRPKRGRCESEERY